MANLNTCSCAIARPFRVHRQAWGHLKRGHFVLDISYSLRVYKSTHFGKSFASFVRWYDICVVRSFDPFCPLTIAVSKSPHTYFLSWQVYNQTDHMNWPLPLLIFNYRSKWRRSLRRFYKHWPDTITGQLMMMMMAKT